MEKDLTYGGIREDAAEERHFSPESFVFNVGLPTLMDMEGCMASPDYPAHNSVFL